MADWKDTFPETAEETVADIYNKIKLPVRATAGSAGFDFFSPVDITLKPGETVKIPTGIRVEMEPEQTSLNSMGGVHAGLMFLMAEAAAGLLVRNDGRTCVTIDSSFRFLRSAGPSEPLYAEARVTKRGRTVSFCHSGVYGRDSGKLFAEGDFTFFCQE